ncbi:MAG TPA: calcium-binding protein, partial [Solirubrobacter sp.]|nr:calcium-binding protein [Solirubrobacter sp.]
MLINAAAGGLLTSGTATLTFGPGSLPADAFVRITPVGAAFDLEAWNATTGEEIHQFLSAPVLSIRVGTLPLAPVIEHIDPVIGPQTIASSYDAGAGTVSAALPHFSIFDVTFDTGAWTVTLADAEPRTITVSATATDVIVTDGSFTDTRPIAGLASLVIEGSAGDDTLVIDTSLVTVGLQVPITFDAGGGNDTLQGPDADSVWSFAGLNGGTLTPAGVAAITFTGTENLSGGSAKDTFKIGGLGAVTGSVTGGAGIEEILLFDAVRITGDMTFDRSAATASVGGVAVPVTLTKVGLASGSVFFGAGAGTANESGFTATISDLALALVSATDDGRTWLAVNATLTGATLAGVDLLGLLGPAASLGLAVNSTASDGSFVDFSGAPVTVNGSTKSIDFSTALLRAAALGVAVDIAGGALSASADLTLERRLVDVDINGADAGGTLTSAVLLTFTANNFSVSSRFGVSISGGSVTVARLTPSAADVTAGDSRVWTAVQATNLSATLDLGTPAAASITGLDVKVNSASGTLGPESAARLSWGTVITTNPPVSLTSTDAFAISGQLSNLSIADVITGSGGFSVVKTTVDAAGLDDARLLVFSLTGLTFGSSFGVSLSVTSLTVATLQPSAADVLAGDTRKWSALRIEGASGSLEFGGAFSASISDVDVEVNSASGMLGGTPAEALDWTAPALADAGISTALAEFKLSAQIDSLSIADVIGGSGGFSVARYEVDAAGLTDARLLVFSLAGLTLSSSFGVSLSVTSLTVATLQPSAADVLAGDTRKWSAIKIEDASGSLEFGGAFSASISAVDVEVNSASGTTAAQPLDWTQAGLEDAGISTALAAFKLSAHIDSLSIADVIGGSGGFSVANSTVDAAGLSDARLLVFSLSNLTLSSSFGVSLDVTSLTVATLQPSAADVLAGDTRKWSALKIEDAGGSLEFGGAFSASISAVDVEVNSASGTPAVQPLDWTQAGLEDAGISTALAAFKLSGHVDSLSIADVIGGAGGFSVANYTVDAAGLTDARLLVFSLSNLTLSSSFGVSLDVTSLTVATLQPSAADVLAGDTRQWSAIKVEDAGGSIALGGALSATAAHVDVEINSASGTTNGTTGTPAQPLDWTAAALADAGITTALAEFKLEGDLTGVDIAGVFSGSAHFALASNSVSVSSLGLTNARLSTFSVSELQLDTAFGLTIDSGTIQVVSLQPSETAAAAGDARKWSAIAVTGLSGSLDIAGIFSATVANLNLKVNSATGTKSPDSTPASPLDWTTDVPIANLTLASNELLSVSGSIEDVDVLGILTGAADFALKQQLVDVDFDGVQGGAALDDATLTTFALTNLSLSVGAGGVGVTIGPAGTLGVAILKPKSPTSPATDSRTWIAVNAKDLQLSLTLPGIGGTVTSGTVSINTASGFFDPNPATPDDEIAATPLDWATDDDTPAGLTIDLDATDAFDTASLVDPGQALPTTTELPITLRGDVLSVGGMLTGIDLFGLVTGSASFAVAIKTVDVDFDGLDSTSTDRTQRLDDAELTLIALTDLHLSVGTQDVGLEITSGTVGIAVLKAPALAAGQGSDNRTWTAVTAKDLGFTPHLPGITGALTNGSLKMNRASGTYTPPDNGTPVDASALDWATADEIPLPLTVDQNADDVWTKPTTLVDPGAALPNPELLQITLRGEQTAVSGTISNLNIFDFVTGSANFALSFQTVDVDLDGNGSASSGEQLHGAGLLTLALDQVNLTIGAAGAGLAVTSGTLGVAILTAPASPTDTRSWLALSAKDLGITLSIPGISATVTDGTVLLNKASGAKNGTNNTTRLDWVTDTDQNGLIDFTADGTYTPDLTTFVDPGTALSPQNAMPVTVRGDVTAVAGKLRNLDVFGIITGGADFAMVSKLVDVDFDGLDGTSTDRTQRLDNASLITFALTNLDLTVGVGGDGLKIGPGGTVGIATIKAPLATGGATDDRSWTAITAKDIAISLSLPGMSAGVSGVSLKINKAAGQYVSAPGATPLLATALDWATDDETPAALTVDQDATDGWSAPSTLVNPGAALPAPGVELPITLRGEQLAIAGKLTGINIFDFVRGSADFEIESTTTAIDLPAGVQDPASPSLLKLGLSDLSLTIGDPDGINFSITGGSLALAIVKATAPTDTTKGDTRSWLALKGSLTDATINGLPDGIAKFEIKSLTVEVNRASGFYDPSTTTANDEIAATPLNWLTQLNLDKDATAGENPDDRLTVAGTPIDFTGAFLRASGRVDIELFGMVSGSVGFAFQQRAVDVNVDGGQFQPADKIDLDNATLTTLALNILSDDGDPANGVENGLFIGAPDKSIGFSVTSGSLAIATIKPSATAAGDGRSWTAITAKIQNGTFSGGGPLKATVNSLGIEINKFAGALTSPATPAAALDWATAVDTGADSPATFTHDDVTIEVETGGAPIVHTFAYTAERLRATGSLSVDILGFVTGTVGVAYETKTVDARIATGDDLDDASLTLISLSVSDIFIGVPQGPGFTITSGKLSLAMLKPNAAAVAAGDGRSWLALTATLGDASLTGIDGLTLSLTDVSATINRGSGLKNNVIAPALDWATAFDDDVVVKDENDAETTIDLSGDQLSLAGTATFDFFGFVSGSATLDFSQRTVPTVDLVEGPDLTDARLTTLGLTLTDVFIGANGIGFSLDSGTLAVATLKPAAPAQGQPADPRGWTAVYAQLDGATLTGLGSTFNLTAQTLKVEINTSSGGATPPKPLDWGTAIGGAPVQVGTVSIALSGKLLRVAGTLSLDIADFVHASGSFSLEKGDNVFVTRAGETATHEATLLRVGVSGGTVFAGVGTAADGVGVSLEGVSFGLALMKEVAAGGASYTVFKGGGTAHLVGVDVLTLTGTLQVELNQGSVKAADLTKLPGGKLDVATGPNDTDPKVSLDFENGILRAAGKATIAIDQFAYLSADFAFEKDDTPFSVSTAGASPVSGQVTALKIGATNGYAFFGVGGPYFNADGTLADGSDDAMGLAVSDVTLGIALMKPGAGQFSNTYKSFFALKASGNVALVGIDAFQISIDDATIEINDATPVTSGAVVPALDLTTAPGGMLAVPTGIGTPDVELTTNGRLFSASGYVTLQISEFVFVAGTFAFTEGATITGMTVAGGAAAGDLTALTVSATNVNIFAGIGGPYWNDEDGDGEITSADHPLADGAKGLALGGVDFSLALLKPTAAGATKSYYALSASAASIELVGVDGVTFGATNLAVEVNGASDSAAAAGAIVPALNFQAKPLTIGAKTFNAPGARLRVHATVNLTVSEVDIGATMDFEQTTRPNGTKVIKLSLTGVHFRIGDPADPAIDITDASGLVFITNLGMAAQFSVGPPTLAAGDDVSFTGKLTFALNNTNQRVDESFLVDRDGVDNDGDGTIDEDGETVTLDLPAGPYFRLAGTGITITILDHQVKGDFQFETLTRAGQKITRIAVANAEVDFTQGDQGLQLRKGSGAFVFYPGSGFAGTLEGEFSLAAGGVLEISGKPVLEINTTNVRRTETITLENGSIKFDIDFKTFTFTIRALDVQIGDYFTLKGDFTFQDKTNPARTIYGARNVTLFLGEGPYLLEDGSVNPDAVGVVIRNATVGIVRFTQGTEVTTDDRYAISGWGVAELVGLPGLTVIGTLRVRINETGQAVNEIINLPGTPAATIPVQFASSTYTQVFEVGVDADGNPKADAKLKIDAAGILVIEGSFRFTKLPTGRLDVEAVTASVAVNIPAANGTLIEGVKLTGAVRFALGGGLGFQLINFRVTGFSIAGQTIASAIPAPSGQLRPVEADLRSPFAGSNLKASDFENGGLYSDGDGLAHIDVLFKDVNFLGIKADTITDGTPEFTIGGSAAGNVLVNGAGVQIDPSNPNLFRYSISKQDSSKPFFKTDASAGARPTVEVTFLANSFTDNQGASNGFDVETFWVYQPPQQALAADGPAPVVPQVMLLSPFNGTTINAKSLNTRPYLDVVFLPGQAGKLVGIDGNELRITGPGAINVATDTQGVLQGLPTEIAPNTYRYFLTPKAGVAAASLFVNGAVTIEMLATSPNSTTPTWCVRAFTDTRTNCTDAGASVPGKTVGAFTVDSTTIDAASNSTATTIGPLTIDGFTIGLVAMAFKGGKLVLTVGIGANEATLAFGGTAGAAKQGTSGVIAKLTGILGTFDVAVDVAKAAGAISNPAALLDAFSVTGKWSLGINSLLVEVPNVVKVTAESLRVGYDPNYDRATKGPQQILTLTSARIEFPRFGITGEISSFRDGQTVIPGLTVWDDGFRLGRAQLIYRPGQAPQSTVPTVDANGNTIQPGPVTTVGTAPSTISFGGILEFDDLRVGVTNFMVRFGDSVSVSGTIFVASGGVKFLPGRPVSATIADRLTAEPDDTAQLKNTEAISLGIELDAEGKVKAFLFKADTLKLTIGSVLTITARDFSIDTGAGPSEDMVAFGAVGAEVKIGSLVIGGEARNFSFTGDGSFKTKPGFGVFLNVGGTDGSAFKWPSWLPIRINSIGVQWADIQNHPADFVLSLSASVTSIQGIPGLEFSGSIENVKIDVGKLLRGEFPITAIGAIAVSIKGDVFGGQLDAALLGGILRLTEGGQIIDDFDNTTPVAERILYVGVEGGFSFAGIGGISIRFGLSELGPLTVQLSASVPGGILLEPNTGLSINDFVAGVEFFKTLPSIDDPMKLRGPEFNLPASIPADQWLMTIKQQVAAQYLVLKSNPGLNGFTAAFTSPMTITGSAKVFSIYTSQEVFNGQVIVKFSTDGKILVVGKLNFAADNISVSGRLYADLSRISSGEATVLFLADVPDQIRVLTLYGRLKMGFRNASGQEVEFVVPDEPPLTPTPILVGPQPGGGAALADMNGRGFVDVSFTMPGGVVLDRNTISDLDPEFDVTAVGDAGAAAAVDSTEAPLLLDAATNTYRYWLRTKGTVTDVTVVPIEKSWTGTNTATQESVPAPGTLSKVQAKIGVHWVDVKLVPTAGQTVSLASVASSDLVVTGPSTITASTVAPTRLADSNVFRFYVEGAFVAGTYSVSMAAGGWSDSGGPSGAALSGSFTVSRPRIELSLPFGGATAIDVGTANLDVDDTTGGNLHYVDVTFIPAPGEALDYATIFDPTADFTLKIGSTSITLAQPKAIELLPDATTGRLTGHVIEVTPDATTGALTDADEEKLRTAGITRFRYRFDPGVNWAAGTVTVTTAKDAWNDVDGGTLTYTLVGPTATLSNPFAGTGIDINLLNRRNWIDIVFPGSTALDPDSITDADAEVALSGPGLGSIAIDVSQTPYVDAAARTVRYFLTGFFLPGAVEATIAAGSYAYSGGAAGQAGSNSFSDLHLTNDRTYLDVTFKPTAGGTLSDIGDADAEFTVPGLTPVADGEAIKLSTDAVSKAERWRYFFAGTDAEGAEFAAPGDVTVTFADDQWSSGGYGNDGSTQTFTVLGPTANLVGPTHQSTTGPHFLNDRGYLDVGFVLPGGKTLDRSTVTDLDPEFTLNSGLAFVLDATQAPQFLREDGSTVYFRYWTRGSYGSGQVTITFLSGSFGFADGTLSSATGSVAPTDFLVDGVATPNIGYIDVQLGPTAGDVLDAGSIDDADAEFTLTGSGVGTAALIPALKPTRLEGTSTYRFYLGGDFRPGTVDVGFAEDGFTASGVGTLAETETFTIGQLTGEISDPSVGTVVGSDVLNGRGFFDVTFIRPAYATDIDFASVTDLDPEFTVTEASGIVLDASRAPVFLGSPAAGQYKFRYFYSGPKTGTAQLSLVGAGVLFKNAAGETVPLFAPVKLKVLAEGSDLVVEVPFGTFANLDFTSVGATDISAQGLTFTKLSTTTNTAGTIRFKISTGTVAVGDIITVTYAANAFKYGVENNQIPTDPTATLGAGTFIEVRFNPIGATELDSTTIGDALAEIALSGSGLGDIALDTRAAYKPDILSDGKTVRYYLTGAFVEGDVTVSFLAGGWKDLNGDTGVAGAESFQVIERLQDESGVATPQKVFFIDLSGGLELRLADLTPDPLFEIRGKVTLEIGKDAGRTRFLLEASGTIKVYKLGNLASAAAKFVLEVGDDFSDVEFWGVAAFSANFEFLEQYGIYLSGSVLLQVNTTERTITETLALEGIPGGRLFAVSAAGAPPLPSGTFAKTPLDAAWINLLKTPPTDRNRDGQADSVPRPEITLASGQRFLLQGFPAGGYDLTDAGAQIEGIVENKKWRITTAIGKTFFIETETLLKGDGTTEDVYIVRGEERTYELLPRSLAFEIVGGLKIQPDPDEDPWFQMAGGYYLRITPTRFEFFVTAAATTSLGLSGRAIGLFIIQADRRRDDDDEPLDGNSIPGIAGNFSLEITAGEEPEGGGGGGVGNIGSLFRFQGKVQVVFNTTLEDQTFDVPESFLAVLPEDYPTQIEVFESAPNLAGTAKADPSDTGGFYVKALIQGSITLFDQITLSGFLAFTLQAGGNSFVKIDGAVSANVANLGSLSGTVSFGFYQDIDPDEDGDQVGAVGRATLNLQAGGLIPGVEISGQVLLQFNTYSKTVSFDTVKVKGDSRGTDGDYSAKDAFELDVINNVVQTGTVKIESGFKFMISGTLTAGPLEIVGRFALQVTPGSVKMSALAAVTIGPLGNLDITADLVIDADGLAVRATLDLNGGFGGDLGLQFSGSALFSLNTTGKDKQPLIGNDPIEPGFKLLITGSVTFAGFASASGTISVTYTSGAFELFFDVNVTLGPITVKATGFAGVYGGEDEANPGIVLRLDVSLDASVFDIIKIEAAGEFRLNTTDVNRDAGGVTIAHNSLTVALTGKLKLLEVISLDASFLLQVGGTATVFDPTSATDGADLKLNLQAGEWVIAVSASMDFFGLASMSARGWVRSNGHFALQLHGELVLGSRSFGLVGEFNFRVFLTEVPKEDNPDETEYAFGASFSASVDARLFGISLAGVSLSASVGARGAGQTDLIAEVTVRIHLLFFTISKTATFKIGTIMLPRPVYLAGDGPSASLGTAAWSGGELYLNMGLRAASNANFSGRGVGDESADEIFIVEHVDGAAGNETIKVKGMGREKVYSGVSKIVAYADAGNDTIIVREGVLSAVDLHGGGGNDTLLFYGSGNATLSGDDGDDYIETGTAVPASAQITLNGGGDQDFIVHNGLGGAAINGGGGDDVLQGSAAVDTIHGDDGTDDIDGRGGLDNLFGDEGDDLLRVVVPTAGTFPTIEGGGGRDVLAISASTGNDNLTFSNPDNGNDLKVERAGGGTFEADDVEELAVDLGAGADILRIKSLAGTTVEVVNVNAGQIVQQTGQTTTMTDEDGHTQVVPVVNFLPDGQPDVITVEGLDDLDNTFTISEVNAVGGAMTELRVIDAGFFDVFVSKTKRNEGDTLIVDGLGGDDLLDASSVGDDDPAAGPAFPDLAAIKLIGGEGDDRLIGTPFDDVLDSGTGSDTVTGGAGLDQFFDASTPQSGDEDTLVETQDLDMSLFNDYFVTGHIVVPGNTAFAAAGLPSEQFLIGVMQGTASDGLDNDGDGFTDENDEADPNFRTVGDADRYAAGAAVESIKGLFEKAVVTGGDHNN